MPKIELKHEDVDSIENLLRVLEGALVKDMTTHGQYMKMTTHEQWLEETRGQIKNLREALGRDQ